MRAADIMTTDVITVPFMSYLFSTFEDHRPYFDERLGEHVTSSDRKAHYTCGSGR